jgi:hypothetical protein
LSLGSVASGASTLSKICNTLGINVVDTPKDNDNNNKDKEEEEEEEEEDDKGDEEKEDPPNF